MFATIIEKRISAKANAADWYVLLAAVFPFAPTEGLEIQLKKRVFVKLERVVYNPANMTFWVQTEPLLHPKPNAKKVAEELVKFASWDEAVVEKDLEAAKVSLLKKAIVKLQQLIIQAQTRTIIGKPMGLSLPFDPRGPRRKH